MKLNENFFTPKGKKPNGERNRQSDILTLKYKNVVLGATGQLHRRAKPRETRRRWRRRRRRKDL